MQNVYTVKQVNAYIKNMFAQDFMMNRIYVKGEVSNCKYHTSGHIYFSLKDESGMISCIMFAGQRGSLAFRMQDGMQVIVFGGISAYERDGKYQLYAREIRQDGAGVLYERFQALKQELEEMGMFAPEYKKPIPPFAKTIGIVTAPTGAAIRDIMNISYRRNPYVQLILYPALVQGDGAAESIVRGIHALEKEGVDIMIVGRGGGSLEDLWAFNEEAVARAVFDCTIPVISAVGHETDTTIIDYVSDLRAPTPSAAAELAVYDYQAFRLHLEQLRLRMKRAVLQNMHVSRARLEQYRIRLRFDNPVEQLKSKRQYLADMEEKLRAKMRYKTDKKKQQLLLFAERMKRLSPLEKLGRGYAYVQTESKEALNSVTQVRENEQIRIYLSDGMIVSRAEVIKEGDTLWNETKKNGKNSR
ncbi:MAG: exodeoxyribonuclease VII large subunit [Lachnospiraceae bacterium]|nr:exodeoxyribonuclease VII large subunit [Lachnospiraceae bacterium]